MPPRKRRKKPPRPTPRAHALIPPSLIELASRLKSGGAQTEKTAGKGLSSWSDKIIPTELVPFFESLDIRTLVDVVKRHRWLYCHPLVVRQLNCLAHLRGDERAWQDVGWTWSEDSRPPQADEADERLRELLEAHANALFPGRRITLLKDMLDGLATPQQQCPRGSQETG